MPKSWLALASLLCIAWLGTARADPGACSTPVTPIGELQGVAASAALSGTQTVRGVVIADFSAQDSLRGFYLQNTPQDADGDPSTSDALFVYGAAAQLGAVVQVTGTVHEYDFGTHADTLTELTAPSIEVCADPDDAEIVATDVTLPLADAADFERYEGMLVRFPQTLYVTDLFQLGRFGSVVLSSGGPLPQPTSIAAPGAEALGVQETNALNRIVLDDDLLTQNPDPVPFGPGSSELTASNPLRAGAAVTGLTGVLTQGTASSAQTLAADPVRYRVRVGRVLGAAPPLFEARRARPRLPLLAAGDVTVAVASVNLLNYFNTFGTNACALGVAGASAPCRGANDAAEFERQWPKSISAVLATGADIVVLSELENDGYGRDSALQDLVDKLNAATAPGTFAFVDADAETSEDNALGVDAIRVALVYKPRRVRPVGQTAVANQAAFGVYETTGSALQRNRPALAQAFADAANRRFIVVGVHLKSKSGSCADNLSPVGPDLDRHDGQGDCNLTRTAAVEQLLPWLASDPTGTDLDAVLILGDFNAYAREDPLAPLAAAGYSNLVERDLGAEGYSYVFDGQWGYLDHAFASPALLARVRGVVELHINADEPAVLDYHSAYKSVRQRSLLYAPDAFRASDHDPVVVALALPTAAPSVAEAPVHTVPGTGPWQSALLALLLVFGARRAGLHFSPTGVHLAPAKCVRSRGLPDARGSVAMIVLGIESSCDETAAAVVHADGTVLSDVVSSQVALHAPYGGVVPELAARAHMENIVPVVEQALAQVPGGLAGIQGIAVTQGPGLIGALLVGVQAAKAMALARSLPLVGVNHLIGHLLAVFLQRKAASPVATPDFPFIALLVSGGHTALYEVRSSSDIEQLGQTRDDAAGEAFDKAAKLLGLGYPGGPRVDRLAALGDATRISLPRPMAGRRVLEFSFSGLKTALAQYVAGLGSAPSEQQLADICAVFQHNVTSVLVEKALAACERRAVPRLVVTGGVAANRGLRALAQSACAAAGIALYVPEFASCTDNAAMIAYAGAQRLSQGADDGLELSVFSRSPVLGAPDLPRYKSSRLPRT